MAAEIITKEDLEIFGQKLLTEIKALLGKSSDEPKKWLKSYQVKNLLKISPNTLHKLRQDGTLTPSKIGGILYYSYDEIMSVLNGHSNKK
ncbi:helix-turn-helix domain-containing protein [Mucilaginibacter corticis]|uniref:Helix-turn-helix domain-containing protein n=1 Tax=Mucilaginibacter corticis TaxID=2597670 RepID=A0A556M7P7_9SPHI|nr:helix-turn-helix domain-containing protein [Mucilaginibacter corticis]TSJ35942.1 helix-turn-helix domain-containing protein [Mucilaginibacter corticis]